MCDIKLGEYGTAVELCTMALAIEPDHIEGRYRRASALTELSEYDKVGVELQS